MRGSTLHHPARLTIEIGDKTACRGRFWMPPIGLLAQHVRAIERVAGPRGPMELEALAVAASPVTAGAREDCL